MTDEEMAEDQLNKAKEILREYIRINHLPPIERNFNDELKQEAGDYTDFLKHLGINKDLMLSDMYTRLPDYEKPVFLKRCKAFESCESAKYHGCKGCNVWNYLYDINALQKWCKENNKDFMQFTMEMHKMLKDMKEND